MQAMKCFSYEVCNTYLHFLNCLYAIMEVIFTVIDYDECSFISHSRPPVSVLFSSFNFWLPRAFLKLLNIQKIPFFMDFQFIMITINSTKAIMAQIWGYSRTYEDVQPSKVYLKYICGSYRCWEETPQLRRADLLSMSFQQRPWGSHLQLSKLGLCITPVRESTHHGKPWGISVRMCQKGFKRFQLLLRVLGEV